MLQGLQLQLPQQFDVQAFRAEVTLPESAQGNVFRPKFVQNFLVWIRMWILCRNLSYSLIHKKPAKNCKNRQRSHRKKVLVGIEDLKKIRLVTQSLS